MKKVLIIAPVFAALAFAGSASAQDFAGTYGLPGTTTVCVPGSSGAPLICRDKIIGNGTSTSSRAYRLGVKAYEAGKLDKAQLQFERGLLADGLDAEIMVYLIKIAEQKGETQKAESYKLAYNNYVVQGK